MADWENMNAGVGIDFLVAHRAGFGVEEKGPNIIANYSGDWAATGKLIDYIESLGWQMTLRLLRPGVYEAAITKGLDRYAERAQAAQLAVTKSFLKATETEMRSLDIA